MEDTEATLAADATRGMDDSRDATVPHRPEASRPLQRGDQVARYVVLAKLGSGGMGIVFAAYDPELDRKVALKLLLPDPGGSLSSGDGRSRLLREAQAMARLSHPNVVAIHDVGVHEQRVFLAMEFVDGGTLGAWSRSQPRAWPDVLSVFRAAGRGLAAAHERGLIHRDFKPDNVMLDERGAVKVMDFGLARAQGEAPPAVEIEGRPTLEDGLSSQITRAGAIMGTPAYMAPEQHVGAETGAKTDQFAFCVALYEVLYGQRPFAGESWVTIAAAVAHGEIREPPRSSAVPAWLRRVVLRGLSVAPDDRWPSMDALLHELGRDPTRGRRRALALAAAGAVALAGGAAWHAVPDPAVACMGMREHLSGVWDEDRRAGVQQALLATGLAYAEGTWERVEGRLDAYARAWTQQRREPCEATRIVGEQSEAVMDLRMACLDDRLRGMRATIDVLSKADAELAPRAIELVASLGRLERCSDSAALSADVPPPEDPQVAAAVIELDDRLATIKALELAGRYTEAMAMIEAAQGDAAALEYPPVLARALTARARLESRLGDAPTSMRSGEQALALAIEHGLESVAAAVSTQMVYVLGDQLARHEQARSWGSLALAYAKAARDVDSEARAYTNLGSAAFAAADYEQAGRHFARALALLEANSDESDPNLAAAVDHTGMVLTALGDHAGALQRHERALAIFERVLGPEHPHTATTLNNLGAVALELEEYDSARRYWERALVLFERSLGEAHPTVAMLIHNLGEVASDEKDYQTALEHHERSRGLLERALGPDHPAVAYTLDGICDDLVGLGRPDEAIAVAVRSLALRQQHAIDPSETAEGKLCLSRALWTTPVHAGRDRERARRLAVEARDLYAAGGPGVAEDLAKAERWLLAMAGE